MSSDFTNKELEWLLKEDIGNSLLQLKQILIECSKRFQMPSSENECIVKPSQYNLFYCAQNQVDSIKIKTKLDGFKLTNADISIKLGSKHPMQTIKTCINECAEHSFPWRLHQIQDAANHLSYAIDILFNLNFSQFLISRIFNLRKFIY